jgi:hypothetical protein
VFLDVFDGRIWNRRGAIPLNVFDGLLQSHEACVSRE